MATTLTERKLLIGGEWIDTGDWIDVDSPYSGETVGRVAKAGAAEVRHAIDAAEAAMREPLPAHKRAEILVRVAGYLGRRNVNASFPSPACEASIGTISPASLRASTAAKV